MVVRPSGSSTVFNPVQPSKANFEKRVRLLSAVPVGVHDEAGEDKDQIWYLIHGKMLGFYRNRDTKRHIRGDLQDKAFFEYWLFVRRNGRWVLHQIRQRNEMDIQEFLE